MTSLAFGTQGNIHKSADVEFPPTNDVEDVQGLSSRTSNLAEMECEIQQTTDYEDKEGKLYQATDLPYDEEQLTQTVVSNKVQSAVGSVTEHNLEINNNTLHNTSQHESHKKCVYFSYSPEADFVDKQFAIESMRYLKRQQLSDDIWLDINDCADDGPSSYISRMDAIESAKVAILFFSESYLSSDINCISVLESKLLSHKARHHRSSLTVLVVMYKAVSGADAQLLANTFNAKVYDLTRPEFTKKTLQEKSQLIGKILSKELVKFPFMKLSSGADSLSVVRHPTAWKSKRMRHWSMDDVIQWLTNIGVKIHHQTLFREREIIGAVLETVTEADLLHSFGIQSHSVRSAIYQKKVSVLKSEIEMPSCWYLKLRRQRRVVDTSFNCVFIIHDSLDKQLLNNLHRDLSDKGIHVLNKNLTNLAGKSDEEVLKAKSSLMSMSSVLIVLLTNLTCTSTTELHEVLCAVWLDKRIITLVFDNVWSLLSPSMQCLLGDRLAIDFSSHLYEDTLDKLVSYLKPQSMTGIVLEPGFVDSINNSFLPLATLSASVSSGRQVAPSGEQEDVCNVFISYHLDSRASVENIHRQLVGDGLVCHLDSVFSYQTAASQMRALHNGTPPSGGTTNVRHSWVMLVCLTSKYLQSPVCCQQLIEAAQLSHRIIPVMLSFSVWPPDGAAARVRRILARYVPIDLSNDKTYSRNMKVLINTIYKVSKYST